MRGFAYVMAALIAVVIMVVVAGTPKDSTQPANANPTESSVSFASQVLEDEGSLTLSVPEMHCAVMCYPKVQKLLEANESVEKVELAAQKEEGMIDNHAVIVHYKPGFDVGHAIGLLEKEGFAKSSIAETP